MTYILNNIIMKKFLSYIVLLILLVVNNVFYTYSSFEYNWNINSVIQDKLQSKVKTLYTKLSKDYSKLWEVNKKKFFLNLTDKIDLLLTKKKFNETNIYILNYLKYLINEEYKDTNDSFKENIINVELKENVKEDVKEVTCVKYYFKVDWVCKNIKESYVYKSILDTINSRESLEKEYSDRVYEINKIISEQKKEIESQKKELDKSLEVMKQKNHEILDEFKAELEAGKENNILAYSRMWLPNWEREAESTYQNWLRGYENLKAQTNYDEAKYESEITDSKNKLDKILSDYQEQLDWIQYRKDYDKISLNVVKNTLKYLEDNWDESWAIYLLTSLYSYWDLIWIDDYVRENWTKVDWHYRTKPNDTKVDNLSCLKHGGSYCY